jgi:hypothetical protein
VQELRRWRPRVAVSRGLGLGTNWNLIIAFSCLGIGTGILAFQFPVSVAKSVTTVVSLVSLGVAGTMILLGRR